MKRKKLAPRRNRASHNLDKLLSNSITVKPRNKPKDEIVYVRFEGDDVRRLDRLAKKLKIDTRSEVVRNLTCAAMNSKAAQKYL
jgi:hypothetical protein